MSALDHRIKDGDQKELFKSYIIIKTPARKIKFVSVEKFLPFIGVNKKYKIKFGNFSSLKETIKTRSISIPG